MNATTFLAVLIALLALGPAQAAVAADATLYELSEEMTIDSQGYRWATSSFQGTAQFGTPLCPHILATLLALGDKPTYVTSCTVSGVGSDKVDIAMNPSTGWPLRSTFGTGQLWGKFAVVVNADNPVDAPEYVVMTGSFKGDMSLTAAAEFTGKRRTSGPITQRIALRTGVFTPENVLGFTPDELGQYLGAPAQFLGLASAPFSGTFRLPFAVANGAKQKPRKGVAAFYLDDADRFVPVQKDETALGYPNVRIEVNFGH